MESGPNACANVSGVFFNPTSNMCQLPCTASQFYDATSFTCINCQPTGSSSNGLQTCTNCPKNCKACSFNSKT